MFNPRLITLYRTLVVLVTMGSLTTGLIGDDWLQWRGPNRNDISKETGLLQSWPEGGPKQLWVNNSSGLGYAGFSIRGDDLFTLGLEEGREFVLCLNAETGKEKWRANIGSQFKNRWGDGPRTTPTIDGDNIYCFSANGTLASLKAASGEVNWSVEMSDFGGTTPYWGYSESPLVDGDKVVVTAGGANGAVVAVNKNTGAKMWQTSSLTEAKNMAYSSALAIDWGGRRQFVKLLSKSVVGLDAESGEVIWKVDWPGEIAVIPTPIFDNGTIHISSGYKVGSMSIKLDEQNNATEVWKTVNMQNHHGGLIMVDGYVYGYCDRNGWSCQDMADGELKWNQGRRGALKKGAVAYADGRFYHLQERDGQVALLKADANDVEEVGRFTLSPQTKRRKAQGKIWVHPVISDGKLYLRDQEYIYCYDIKS